MPTQNEIAYLVSQMRSFNRPLTVAEAMAQVEGMFPLLSAEEAHDTVLRVLGLIAAQEFMAARAARKLGRK